MPLLLAAALYGLGTIRMLRRTTNKRLPVWPVLCFALGWISLVIAVDSPLHELGEQLFWAHMTQHETAHRVESDSLGEVEVPAETA